MRNIFLVILFCLGFCACGVRSIVPPDSDSDYEYTPKSESEETATSDSESSSLTETDSELSSTETSTETSSSTQTYPTVAEVNSESDDGDSTVTLTSSDTSSAESVAAEESTVDESVTEVAAESEEPQFDWNRVLITEVVTDPQQDHGESTIGNAVKFDATPGTGTVGSTDEYVEIFNGTDTVVDVSQWSVAMNDGSDVTETFTDANWENFFSTGGSVADFGPGEFLVLGNPDGTINNTLTVELFDETGGVIDSLTIEDANAVGLEDEAYYLTPDGEWEQGAATPGFFPE